MGNFNSQQKKQQDHVPDYGAVPGAIGSVIDWPDRDTDQPGKEWPIKRNSREFATLIFEEYNSDTESGLDSSRGIFIQGTFDSWKDALYNLWVEYGSFRHGYVAIQKDGRYQKDCNPDIKNEWNRLLAHQELNEKLEAIRRARAFRKAEQRNCINDLEQTIDIIEAPENFPFGEQKLGFAKRHLHNLLDFTYNETLWSEDNSTLAVRIHKQVFRCRNLPDYAHKALHGLPSPQSEGELSGHEPDSDEDSDHIIFD